jgi:hypothetical protein
LSRMPVESILFDLARSEGTAAGRIRDFLLRLRHRTPSLSGDDILALGVRQGPEVGRVLREIQRLRVEGRVKTREQELVAARRLAEQSSE